jgi:hypothetical protein
VRRYGIPTELRCEKLSEISLAMPFYRLKVIVLPRQARDNHRERTQKREMLFFAYRQKVWPALRHADRKREGARLANKRFYTELVEVRRKKRLFVASFILKTEDICQGRLGTNAGKAEKQDTGFLAGVRGRGVH